MKIFEVIPSLNVGGAEVFVVNLTNELVQQGHECKLATLFSQGKEKSLYEHVDNAVQRLSLSKRSGLDVRCMFRLLREIKKYKPDIVHAHIGAISYLCMASLFFRRCKYFATIHSEARRESGGFFSKCIRFFMFKLKLVLPITISEESLLSFEKFYGMTPSLIYNGTPDFVRIENKSSDKIIFVHPASCQPVKNQKRLFEAFQIISRKYNNVELHWYGSHSQYENLFNKLSEYFSETIMYKGVTGDLRRILMNARAMCLSSDMEGMPMTIIEAMSVGCIPVATPVGGCVNMIDNGRNGFLSESMEVDTYAAMLENVIKMTDSEREEIQKCARTTYENKYTIKRCATAYVTLFKNLM